MKLFCYFYIFTFILIFTIISSPSLLHATNGPGGGGSGGVVPEPSLIWLLVAGSLPAYFLIKNKIGKK